MITWRRVRAIVVAILLVSLLVLHVDGMCASEDKGTLGSEEAKRAFREGLRFGRTVGQGDYTVGVVMCLFDQPYWVSLYAAMVDGAVQNNVKLITVCSDLSVEKEMAQVEDFITRKVDGLIMIPVSSEASTAAVIKANRAGIPVVHVNRTTSGGDVYSVMMDNVDLGRAAAIAMKKAAGTKKIKAMELVGDLKIQIAVERSEGFLKKAAELGDFDVVCKMPTEWLHENVYPAVVDGFSAHPDVNAIYLSSELMLPGTLAALKSLGKLHPIGHPDHVIVVGVDGQPVAYDNIRKGFVDASINQQNYLNGVEAVKTVVDLIKGKRPAVRHVQLPAQIITRENVDDPGLWGNRFADLL